jgi:hypothetical protein
MDLFANLAETWPPQWVRGPRARHERGWLILEPEGSERYLPGWAGGLAYDLTGVTGPDEAVAFIRRWGLLRHGAFKGDKPLRESFDEWLSTVTIFRFTLVLYDLLQKALAGDEEALAELVDHWADPIGVPFEEPATDREGILAQCSALISAMITRGLAGSTLRLDSHVHIEDDPGTFVLGADSPDLVGFAYYELATIINMRMPVGRCEQCGRFFEVADPRQRFCGTACAGRARSRRYRQARKEAAT